MTILLRSSRWTALAGAVLAGVAMSVVSAQAQLQPIGVPQAEVSGSFRGTDVCFDSRNGVYFTVGANGGVFGAFVNTSGAATSVFGIGTASSALFGAFPRCAYSPELNGGAGGFLVAWHQFDGATNYIHSEVISYPSGPLPGTEQIVSDGSDRGTNAEAFGPGLAYSADSHTILITWTSNQWSLQGRVVNGTTGLLGSGPVIEFIGINGAHDAGVAWNPGSNEFGIAVAAFGDSGGWVTLLRVRPTDGAVTGTSVFGAARGTFRAGIAVLPNNHYVVGWCPNSGSLSAELDQAGNLITGPQLISSSVGTPDGFSLAFNAVSKTILSVGEDAGNGKEVVGAELNAAGTPLTGTQVLTSGATGGSFYPRLSARSDVAQWNISYALNFAALANQIVQTSSLGAQSQVAGPQPLSVTLSADHTFPTTSGTTVTWTATASGGTAPLQYQFWEYSAATGWSIAQAYGASKTFGWAPPDGIDAIQVWVKSAGSTADFDAWAGSNQFTVALPTARITALTANRTLPVAVNVPITWTSTANAGAGAVEYEYWEMNNGAWSLAQAYSTTASFMWFPMTGQHAVQVWARRVGSSAPFEDWRSSGFFNVTATVPASITGLQANTTFPSSPSRPITWSATAIGGAGALEFKFWLFTSSTNAWSVIQDWSSATQATWTPGVGNSGQDAVQVWVRTAGSTAQYEGWLSSDYFLITDSSGLSLTQDHALTSVHAADTVTFTATLGGSGGPYKYEFWTFNGTSWSLAQTYGVSNHLIWTLPAGTLAVQVWTRAIGSAAPWERWATTGLFAVR